MLLFGQRRLIIIEVGVLSKEKQKHFTSFTSAGAEQVGTHCSRRSVESISGFYTSYYYCSYTRGLLCYFDKKCSECLSYYLTGTTLADVDGRHGVGTRVLVELRSDMTACDEWHTSRHVTNGGRLGGTALRN